MGNLAGQDLNKQTIATVTSQKLASQDTEQIYFDETNQKLPDGLNLDNIDAVVRVRNRSGSGTGSAYGETETSYKIVTNYHVAGKTGNVNTIDIWNNGQIVKSIQAKVLNHFFARGANKDISLLEIPKSAIPGKLPVIQMAGYHSESLHAGDSIWQVGCDAGNWTNAERGIVLTINNGVVFYLPNSIPGNSGGPIYSADCSKQLGVTTWVGPMTINGKHYPAVGMAQTFNRFWDIIEGRVSMDTPLPPSAKPIPLSPAIQDNDLLPLGAAAIPLAPVKQQSQQDEIGFRLPAGSSHRWREPGVCEDGRVDPRGNGLLRQRKPDGESNKVSPDWGGPLGLGLFNGSILRVIADFIAFLKWVLIVGILLFIFTIVNQILGSGWLRDFFMMLCFGLRFAWRSFVAALTPTGESSGLSIEEQLKFEAWKKSQESDET